MQNAVAVLALGIFGMGIVGVASPAALQRLWSHWRGPRRILHALARVAFGTLVAASAPATRAPEAVHLLGILCFASGIVSLILRPAAFWSLLAWGLQRSSRIVRAESAVAVAGAAFLLWATLG